MSRIISCYHTGKLLPVKHYCHEPGVPEPISLVKQYLLLILASLTCLSFVANVASAAEFMVKIKSIAQITVDDDNRTLDYPAAVFFDPAEEEIYIINGGRNRLLLYGPDLFPRVSVGSGRGVMVPRGGFVATNGEVFVCQLKTAKNPRSRVTILNGALFPEREIFLDEIPEADGLRPRNLTINSDGIIYLAGDNYRGVVVLDNEGNFLRMLEPMGLIVLRGEEVKPGPVEETGEPVSEEAQNTAEEKDLYANIPEEFRPRSDEESLTRQVQGPVKVNYITRDSTGKLYLLSAETGKIYVYGPDESFLFSFGTKGGSPGQLSTPRALAIDEKMQVIYVVDYMRHTILAYSMAGEYIFEFGGLGTTPGWFNFPNDIAINNMGQLIVADLFNKRIQVLEVDKEGISYYKANPAGAEEEEKSGSQDSQSLTQQNELSEPLPGTPDDGQNRGADSPEETALSGEQINLIEPVEDFESPFEPLFESIQPKAASQGKEILAAKPKELIIEETIQDVKQPEAPAVTDKLSNFTEIDNFINSWVDSWEQQDIEKYLSHYSTEFILPGGLSFTEWEIERHKSLGKPKYIKINIRDIQKEEISDNRARIRFIQEYTSNMFSDRVAKILDLIWEDGAWKIEREESSTL